MFYITDECLLCVYFDLFDFYLVSGRSSAVLLLSVYM